MRRSVTFIAVLFCVAGLAACGSSSKASVGNPYPASTGAGSAAKPATATIETNMGTIVVALDTAKAPVAAGRFIELAEKGFYNGLTFHRVAPNFVIQGGDPKGNGTGGTGTTVAGEVPTDGYPIGSLAAAKTPNDPPGTFDCQFFIVTGNLGTQLPAESTRFGMVTSGLDVAQKIEKLSSGGDGPPSQKVVMTKVTISNT